MTDLFQFFEENKEWIFSGVGATILAIIIPIFIKQKKTKKRDSITINVNNKNNNTNNNSGSNNTNKNSNTNQPRRQTNKTFANKPPIDLEKIKLYSTGVKGKVYTTKFRKSLNHNFGIEITLKNNTSVLQNVRVGWCIYDDNGNTLIKGSFTKAVRPHNSMNSDFYVQEKDFNKLKPGKYKSQFWINEVKVQKEFFVITYK